MSAAGLRRAEAIFAAFPTPPCAALLGWRLVDADPEAGRVEVAFEGSRDFCNPSGTIQGGFLAAMLDDAMGPAVLVASDGTLFAPTIQLSVSFLAPVRPGPLRAEGRLVRRGGKIAFLSGRLADEAGEVVATATACARLLSTERLNR